MYYSKIKYYIIVKVKDGTTSGKFLKYKNVEHGRIHKMLRYLDSNFPAWVYINFYRRNGFIGSMTFNDREIKNRRK